MLQPKSVKAITTFRLEPEFASTERGSSLLEVLVAVTMIGLIFSGLVTQYSNSVSNSYDHSLRIAAQVQAQAVLQTVISELRVLGNGVPFDQANFQIGESTLSDTTVTEPIDIAVTSGSKISFRLNESGTVHLLTADFDPAATTTISLTDVDGIVANDEIYLTNSVIGGDDGLYATVASVDANAKTVTLNADYVTSPGATFDTGTILEEVPDVIYNSPIDGSGVTRNSGYGDVLLAPNSTMSLTYYSFDGTELTPPLTNSDIINSLRSIKVAITLTSPRSLSSGATYTTTVEQRVGIRNLNYIY
jgi:type II secretory pathway pseudopilin PulG